MSDHEKLIEVGRLAEEYSRIKGELNAEAAKIAEAARAYTYAGAHLATIQVQGNELAAAVPPQLRALGVIDLKALLSYRELHHAMAQRERLSKELADLTAKLRQLAPHLL